MNKIEKITIDKTIEIFEGIKKGISPWYPEPYYDMAINTMRKYQEIEQIVHAYIIDNPRAPMYDTEDYMESIKEVVEDGGSEEP